MTTPVNMKQCWAGDVRGGRQARCLERVAADPDHVGLCNVHLAELRLHAKAA